VVTHYLGRLEFEEWRYLEVPVEPARFGQPPAYPLTLLSIATSEPEFGVGSGPGSIFLDDLQVREGTRATIVEDFENIAEWGVLESSTLSRGSLTSSDLTPRGSGRSGAFAWQSTTGSAYRGLFLKGSEPGLPVAATPSFLSTSGRRVGDTFLISVGRNFVPVTVKGVINYFPTLSPSPPGFLVISIDSLLGYLNLFATIDQILPNEVMLKLSDEAELRANLYSELWDRKLAPGTLHSLEKSTAALRDDPLISAGMQALIFVVLLGSLSLSLGGYAAFSLLLAARSTLPFAITRAIGLSRRQLMAFLMVEQLATVALGVLAGTWLGVRISSITISFLEHTEEGRGVLPPFLIEVQWGSAAVVAGALFVATMATIALLARHFVQVPISQALRLGEEE